MKKVPKYLQVLPVRARLATARARLVFSEFSDFPNFQFSDFPICQFSNLPIFRIFDFPMFQFSEFPIFRFSNFPIFQISDFPIFQFQNVRFFKFPIFRTLGFPNFRSSNFPISKYLIKGLLLFHFCINAATWIKSRPPHLRRISSCNETSTVYFFY